MVERDKHYQSNLEAAGYTFSGSSSKQRISSVQNNEANNVTNALMEKLYTPLRNKNYAEKAYYILNQPPQFSEEIGISSSNNGDDMSEQTREEVDAKLAVLEARAETRSVELNAKIDRLSVLIETSIGSLAKDISGISMELRKELQNVTVEMHKVKEDNKHTRWTIVGVAVASVLAGLAALWATQSNLLTAFQTGLSVRAEQHATGAEQNRNR